MYKVVGTQKINGKSKKVLLDCNLMENEIDHAVELAKKIALEHPEDGITNIRWEIQRKTM